jgi:hypothetical protein
MSAFAFSSYISSSTSAYFFFPTVRLPTIFPRAVPSAPASADAPPPPGTDAFDPDDENYSVNYGEYIAIGELDRLSAMQTGSSVLEKFGRYFDLVFMDSYHTYGYIDLWEFVPYGYLQSEAQ